MSASKEPGNPPPRFCPWETRFLLPPLRPSSCARTGVGPPDLSAVSPHRQVQFRRRDWPRAQPSPCLPRLPDLPAPPQSVRNQKAAPESQSAFLFCSHCQPQRTAHDPASHRLPSAHPSRVHPESGLRRSRRWAGPGRALPRRSDRWQRTSGLTAPGQPHDRVQNGAERPPPPRLPGGGRGGALSGHLGRRASPRVLEPLPQAASRLPAPLPPPRPTQRKGGRRGLRHAPGGREQPPRVARLAAHMWGRTEG